MTCRRLIKNKKSYNKNAIKILESGLDIARTKKFIVKYIKKDRAVINRKSYWFSKYNKVWIIAIGKAADSMTSHVHHLINASGGIVVIPHNYDTKFLNKKYRIIYAGHPIPNKNSVLAAKTIISMLENAKKNDLIIFLVSGGTSSLVCLPLGLSLIQKQQITQTLLKSGASINEINAIRKHISAVKGGQLLAHLKCEAMSFIMSDVVNDDLGSIASGMTYCDKTRFSDCLKIIKKYGLMKKIPTNVLMRLQLGSKGKIKETPKKPLIPNIIIASNHDCVDSMEKTAKTLGYKTKTLAPIAGNVDAAAKKILKNFSFAKKSCLVFGGETTVKVTGNGLGGRNQQLVLQILSKLKKSAVVASIGTDGIDGNTKHAGAIFEKIPKENVKIYLRNNDSNSFFKKNGGLLMTGPTHTNLLDIGLIMTS